MIDPATATALGEAAQRVNDLLRSTATAFEPHDPDVRRAAPRIVPDPSALSVAAPADSWFVIDGGGRHVYSRDGTFSVRDGRLVDERGADVVGFAARGRAAAPLRAEASDAALGRIADPRIDADGSFAYTRMVTDPRTGVAHRRRVVVGVLALARFPAGTKVSPDETGTAHASPGIEPHVGRPGDGVFASVATYSRDRGSLDFDLGLVRLHDVYERIDALTAESRAHASLERTALELLK